MRTEALEIAYRRLERLAFPEHPDDDALDTWMYELLEMDGYVAGIASSLLAGHKMDTRHLRHQMARLASGLAAIDPDGLSHRDKGIQAECKVYLALLTEIARYATSGERQKRVRSSAEEDGTTP